MWPASRFAAAQMSVLSLSRNGQAFSRYQERSEGCVGAISIDEATEQDNQDEDKPYHPPPSPVYWLARDRTQTSARMHIGISKSIGCATAPHCRRAQARIDRRVWKPLPTSSSARPRSGRCRKSPRASIIFASWISSPSSI